MCYVLLLRYLLLVRLLRRLLVRLLHRLLVRLLVHLLIQLLLGVYIVAPAVFLLKSLVGHCQIHDKIHN